MITNERSSSFGRRPDFRSTPKPPVQEETIKTGQVQIERKTFVLTLKENPRGRFLRISEDAGGRRDAVIVPATGLEEFKRVFEAMQKASEEKPSKAISPLA